MCTTCGCSGGGANASLHVLANGHRADVPLILDPRGPHGELVQIEARVLAANDRLADQNRAWLRERGIVSLNLMSSPGAGKTTLLVRTLTELGLPCSVLEGDQETSLDAERIRATGAPVLQVNTGQGCHLEAQMVRDGLQHLDPAPRSVLFVENVGNLVCPALFDLGEARRVVLYSVTEGEEKPLKYPHMFRSADLVVVTKIDLLPHLDFDLERTLDGLRQVNPDADVIRVSTRTGEGLGDWYRWIHNLRSSQET